MKCSCLDSPFVLFFYYYTSFGSRRARITVSPTDTMGIIHICSFSLVLILFIWRALVWPSPTVSGQEGLARR